MRMYETQQDDTIVGEAAASTDGQRLAGDYSRFGEHVASVLTAAEAAAERLTEQAHQKAEEILADARNVHAQADVYAEQKQREADAEAAKTLEGAELTASRQVYEARQRNETLHKDLELTETRLHDLVTGLRTLASHLEELLGTEREKNVDEALRTSLNATVGANTSAQDDN